VAQYLAAACFQKYFASKVHGLREHEIRCLFNFDFLVVLQHFWAQAASEDTRRDGYYETNTEGFYYECSIVYVMVFILLAHHSSGGERCENASELCVVMRRHSARLVHCAKLVFQGSAELQLQPQVTFVACSLANVLHIPTGTPGRMW
jgi:hypothetical protein